MQYMFARMYGGVHVNLRHITATAVTCLLLTMFNSNAFAEDDDYLKALEEEAINSANVGNSNSSKSKRNKNISKPKSVKSNNRKKVVKSGSSDQRKKFEQLLQFELPSTYKFYSKLNEDKKNTVYKAYKRSNKLSTASKKIFDLYFKQN